MSDDATARQMSGETTEDVLLKHLTTMVIIEAGLSGKPVDEIWALVEAVASRSQCTVD